MKAIYSNISWLRGLLVVIGAALLGSLHAADAPQSPEFTRAVTATRTALAARDMTAAKRSLTTVKSTAKSHDEQAQAVRLEMLVENVEQFWNGIRAAVAKFQPTEEIMVGKERVAIIDASRNELSVQMYGRPQHWRIEAIPIPLIGVIARQAFAPTPGSKVVVASFMIVDREGDRKDARKLLEEAAKAGESEGKMLMPELDIPLPPGGPAKKTGRK